MSFLGFGKKKGPPSPPSTAPSGQPATGRRPEASPAAPDALFGGETTQPEQSVAQPAQSSQPAAPHAAAPVSANVAASDWRQPSLTTYKAHELGISQELFDAAFEQARAENDRGAPFGGALWSALMRRSRNYQAVDDLVDELPNEAFGPGPSPHFEFIIRCWAHATAAEDRPELSSYKSLAITGGWRPGDVNSALLYEQLVGPPPVLQRLQHPMGLDMLPRELTMSRMEMAVYSFLSDLLARSQGASTQ